MNILKKYRQFAGYGFRRRDALVLAIKYRNL
jgi:hypothetical protein